MRHFIGKLSFAATACLLLVGFVFAPPAFAQLNNIPVTPGTVAPDPNVKIDPNTGQPVTAQGATGGASSGSKAGVCEGISMATGQSCDDPNLATGVDNIVTTVIDVLSIIVGIVAVIMIIVGGLKYITSGGDSNSITSAKNTIMYAVVGLVIVILAQTIVKFVVSKL